MKGKYRDLQERLLANSVIDPDTGCWIWIAQAPVSSRGGSPRPRLSVRVNGKHRKAYAHRLSYEAFVGPVPTGYEVGHSCDNTRCIAPDHLHPMTHGENMRIENARRHT